MALQETWFDSTVEDHELTKNTNFVIERQDRSHTTHPKKGGGGVALIIRNALTYKRMIFQDVKFLNYACVLLQNPKLCIVCVYFPQGFPEASVKDFAALMNNLQNISKTAVLVIGDFNMPMLKWLDDDDIPGSFLPLAGGEIDTDFVNILFGQDLKQIAPPPTNRNHLDLVYVDDVESFHMVEVQEVDLIDRVSIHHSPMGVKYLIPNSVKDRSKSMNFGRTNMNNARIQLSQHRFFEITEEEAIEEDFFGVTSASERVSLNVRAMKDVLNRNTPLRNITQNWISKHPWLKNSLEYEETLVRKRRAKTRLNNEDSQENRDAYRTSSFELSGLFSSLRDAYIKKVIDESNGNTYEFYSLMKNGAKAKKDTPSVMISEGIYVEGEVKLAALARHLGSNFLQNPPDLGQSFSAINDRLFEIYQSNFNENNLGQWDGLNLKLSGDKVAEMIKELNSKKDAGPMKLSADFLKFNVDLVAPVIANAINTMIVTGNVPNDWKECYLIPIPKKGSQTDIKNYRGIAIQSCLPKLLDKFITEMLYEYLGDSISKDQHGFMRGRSTATNLLEITQFLHENQKDNQIDVIYFDYSKAFDQVRHDILAAKLSETGMPYSLYRLIMNFVIDRRYILKVDGEETNFSITPKSSVPQGSHFGPILFLLFINEIGGLCYADDAKIFKVIKNMEDRNALQDRIDGLESWSTMNGLTLNPSKTFHVSYGKSIIASTYFLKGESIATKKTVRDLGVVFDDKLNFGEHIKIISARMNQMIGAARRMVNEIKQPMLMHRIFSVYIRPIGEYCSIIWDQGRFNDPITLAHKKATRIAMGVYFTMPPELYITYEKRCEILEQDNPVTRRRTQAAITCIKILKGITNLSFNELILNHLDLSTRNRRRNHLLLRTNRAIPTRSPVARMLAATTEYESVIRLDQELSTIKGKIKDENRKRREALVASRQPARSSSRSVINF